MPDFLKRNSGNARFYERNPGNARFFIKKF